jgi:glutathione synthase/RimK-type ligase-like ATP-grasp enzyme
VKKRLIVLTGYDHFFGQSRKPWVSIDTKLLLHNLHKSGIEIDEVPFHKVANNQVDIKDSIVFYTFSQRDNLRSYINDVVFNLANKGNHVIPSLELLRCHENKGIQECIKHNLKIDNLKSLYLSSKRELIEYQITYPVVLKTITGSNGKGVFLIQNKSQLLKTISDIEPKLYLATKLDLLRRKYLRLPKIFPGYERVDLKKDYEQYGDYITPEKCFVLQEFISGLEFDYRVIILGKHFFVTKRLTRKDDFRASGAKRFTFDFQATDELLDYAQDIYNKFSTPCLSLDIGVKDNQYYLFEFQALHFGINAIVRGKGYYHQTNKGWEFQERKVVFEDELSNSLIEYLNKMQLI